MMASLIETVKSSTLRVPTITRLIKSISFRRDDVLASNEDQGSVLACCCRCLLALLSLAVWTTGFGSDRRQRRPAVVAADAQCVSPACGGMRASEAKHSLQGRSFFFSLVPSGYCLLYCHTLPLLPFAAMVYTEGEVGDCYRVLPPPAHPIPWFRAPYSPTPHPAVLRLYEV